MKKPSVIAISTIAWFDPASRPPPFDMRLLIMVAGSRSDDAGMTWETYTTILSAYVRQTSPGDDYDDESAIDEYLAGDRTDFMDFQFDLGLEDYVETDWYSDAIVAWAYYPLNDAREAVSRSNDRKKAGEP